LTEYLNRRLSIVVLTLVAILFGTFILFKVLPGGFVPEEDQAYLLGAFMLPEGASLQRTKEVMEDIEAIVAEFEPVQNSSIVAGFSALTGTISSNAGFVFVQLKPWDERPNAEDTAVNVGRMQRTLPSMLCIG